MQSNVYYIMTMQMEVWEEKKNQTYAWLISLSTNDIFKYL